MTLIEKLVEDAKAAPSRRVALPECEAVKTLLAARRVLDEGVGTPVLVSPRDTIEATASEAGVSLGGMEVVDTSDEAAADLRAKLRVRGERTADPAVVLDPDAAEEQPLAVPDLPHPAPDTLRVELAPGPELVEPGGERPSVLGDELADEVVLRGEEVVEGALGDARLLRDVLDAQCAEALPEQVLPPYLEQARPQGTLGLLVEYGRHVAPSFADHIM